MKKYSWAVAAKVAGATLALSVGAVSAAPPHKAPPPIMLYDSNDKPFGRVLSEHTVIATLNGVPIALTLHGVFSGADVWETTDFPLLSVYFESTDCSGQPLLLLEHTTQIFGVRRGAIVPDQTGRRFVYPAVGAPFNHSVQIFSRYQAGCQQASESGSFIPAGSPIDVSEFVPPFKIK